MKRLEDVKLSPNRKRMIYEHTWRPDFVGEALTVDIDSDRMVLTLEFYSSQFGIVRWVHTHGFLPSRCWEAEGDQDSSLAGQRYPAFLLNGKTPFSNTRKIVESVLVHASLTDLKDVLSVESLNTAHELKLPPEFH